MYKVDSLSKPSKWWHTVIYGWYFPAICAMVWFTQALWMPSNLPFYDDRIELHRIGLLLPGYILMATSLLNALLLIVLNLKKHWWLAIVMLGELLAMLPLYMLIKALLGLQDTPQWSIPTMSSIRMYDYDLATMLTGVLLSAGLIVSQSIINPKAYHTRLRMLGAWLALGLVITGLIVFRQGIRIIYVG
ncbi:MAG: hypothetical protein LCH85_01545 [Chloroflexi bacterium]|nr:hypothetical protein [Chloroflexota bacterium]